MFKKIFFALVLFFGGSLRGEEFVVGTTSGYAPYVSLNAKGVYEGFDVDVAGLVAERLGRKLVLKDLGSMPSLLMGLKRGKVDAVIWAVSITEERRREMAMVYYQGEKVTEMPFLFWKKVPEGVKGIGDLRGVCVEAGSYQEGVMKGREVRFVDKIVDGILEIRYGKSVAVAVDSSLVPRLQVQYPELRVLSLPLPEGQQSLGNGICIAKSRGELVREVERVVGELRGEGKIAELEKKWGLK